ncbi:DEAD/DEAH box helicase, partial [Klebsiella pneumoniae]|uniref:DEAD/DEAH box helicase n=2 Tax=Pseudomonadota TaxID=1224 RepID=UPI002DBCC21C
DARSLHPKAVAVLDAWCETGWVQREVVDPFTAGNSATPPVTTAGPASLPVLTDEQTIALAAITGASGFAPFLLHGVTGSGKTEVYLRALAHLLERRPDAQALVLVPEINLTPQFEAAFRARFASLAEGAIV